MSKPNKLILEGHIYLADAEIQGSWLVIADQPPSDKYVDYDYVDERFREAFDMNYAIVQPGSYLGKLRIIVERIE